MHLPCSGKTTHISVAAYHEAGHALAALWQGIWVGEISVDHDDPGAGLMKYSIASWENPFGYTVSPGQARLAWQTEYDFTLRLIRVALAGPLAEAQLLNTPLRHLGSVSDLDDCGRHIRDLYESWQALPEEAEVAWPGRRILNQTRDEVRRWVRRPKTWKSIHMIAACLAAGQELDAVSLGNWIGWVNHPDGQYPIWF